jgi:type VI protein secretion system component VasK
MASKIGLCHELWKFRSKKSLPQIAHPRCRESRCIAIGNLTLVILIVLAWLSLRLSSAHGLFDKRCKNKNRKKEKKNRTKKKETHIGIVLTLYFLRPRFTYVVQCKWPSDC